MSSKEYPGTCKMARPEIFNIQAMPPQPTVLKPGQLPESKIRKFFENGYLHVENFFTDDELDECLKAIEDKVDDVAKQIYEGGGLKNFHDDKSVFERLVKLEQEFPGAATLVYKHGGLPKAFKDLWSNGRLLNLLEQVLGDKICANPVWNVRPKSPENPDCDVPWHQDAAYFDPASYGTLTIVAWIPLLDVYENNGCMQLMEGGHRNGFVNQHLACYADTWQLMMDESKIESSLGIDLKNSIKTFPMKKGGVLLFTNLTPHRSLPNNDTMCRWSLDLRFQRPGEPEGLYGKLPPVLLRDPSNPTLIPDWSSYDVNRHRKQREMTHQEGIARSKLLDTVNVGPWMKMWPLVNSNKHTEAAGVRLDTGR